MITLYEIIEIFLNLIMESRIITIGGNGVNCVEVGNNKPLVFIGGPCAIESEKHTMFMAEKISEICSDLSINGSSNLVMIKIVDHQKIVFMVWELLRV